MKLLYKLATIAALAAPLTLAQDSSGNAMLNGNYRFRYVAPLNYNNAGNIIEVTAAEGVITFNGAGSYTIAQGSTFIDNTQNSGKPQEFPTGAGGSYAIDEAGIGYIESPLNALSDDFEIAESGTVSEGVFTGSATEAASETGSGLNDMFVVMAVGTPATLSTFTSPYWLGVLDFSGGGDALLKNAITEITPNGSGGFGALTVTGLTNNYQSGTLLTQTVSGATYSLDSNGDGGINLTLPLPTGVSSAADAMFSTSGSVPRLMYVSANGNFVLGWNPNGYDIIFGVQALTVPPTSDSLFSGLFYLGNLSDIPEECGAESFWGSVNADGLGDAIEHQRFYSAVCSNTGSVTDYGTDDYLLNSIGSDGTVGDTNGNYYAFGASGNAFVAVSNSSGFYSLTIGIHAPSFSGPGVYLNPIGVVNAASWDPVTASVAPGELITLFGTNLSASPQANIGGQPFGTALGGTQVLVNNAPAPIYYVSPTQVSAIIPYEVACANTTSVYCYAEVQVNNLGQELGVSNQVSVYLTDANSGIFSVGPSIDGLPYGIGDTDALHSANYTQVSQNSPALPGEIVLLPLTGMGAVTPTIEDGAVPPLVGAPTANNFTTANELVVLFNDYVNNVTAQQATVGYAGLWPGLVGLYQMNVQIPTTVGPGDVYIEIVTDAADNDQVTICVTGSCEVNDTIPSATSAKFKLRPALTSAAKLQRPPKGPPHTTKTAGLPRIARPSLAAAQAPALAVSSPFPQN
jgi:uncharacterized protein (TIGR03437 family)